MSWIKQTIIAMLLLSINFYAFAQEEITSSKYKASTLKGLYLGTQASTNGWGGNIRYAFNDWFSLRSGYEILNLNYDFDFDENDVEYEAGMDFETGGIMALVDLAYAKNLYVSGGIVFTHFNTKIAGLAASDLEYGDITIPAEDIGDFTFTAKPGLKAAPYGGAGYRAFWGKRDGIVFNFETGLYYMGAPDITIEATGLLAPTADPAFGQEEYLENQFDAYKIYPVIKLGLAVKLF